MALFDRSCSFSIATMAVFLPVLTKRDIGRKTPIFHSRLLFNLHDRLEPLRISPKISTQSVRIPQLLDGIKYCRKVQPYE